MIQTGYVAEEGEMIAPNNGCGTSASNQIKERKESTLQISKKIIEDSEVKKLVYSEKRDIVHQIVNGLDYLVKQSIIHCDLTPANILESENGRIKIADMGLSRKLIKERNFESTDYNVATLWYRAPEVMRKTPYSFPIDMWSLGLIIAELWFGKPLLREFNEAAQLKAIENLWDPRKREYINNFLTNVEKPAADLVKHLLQTDPKQRATISMVKDYSFLAESPENDNLSTTFNLNTAHVSTARSASSDSRVFPTLLLTPPTSEVNKYHHIRD
ncbi:CDK6 [Cordylochernes scorpioides]|uniref:CDK6 n=1 Tax=Cordylochernes scorpioides TaxID=51811 RepID=A0ABY6LNA6_9ARAC|nr:CDK6 [Cordylochernes scorpioides]